MKDDTIAAISTPHGRSALGVIRLSGPDSINIIRNMFKFKGRDRSRKLEDRKLYLGDLHSNGKSIDQSMVCVMRGTATYTGEDMAEISCHGSPMVIKRVLQECVKLGARLADPGEFTRRAFLNGKIDLTKAEAIADLIHAKSERAADLALLQLKGQLNETIEKMKTRLIDIASELEAGIDFPEEELILKDLNEILRRIEAVLTDCRNLRSSYETGRTIKEGIKIVIVGKQNVGKSSLFNRLIEYDRAIVTDQPGTTRDVLTESLNLNGMHVMLIDTAGIGREYDKAGREGVNRSLDAIKNSDFILFVLDRSSEYNVQDEEISTLVESSKGILIYNKSDLSPLMRKGDIKGLISRWGTIEISALSGEGISDLKCMIKDLCESDKDIYTDGAIICNIRHLELIDRCIEALDKAIGAADNGYTEEIIVFEVKRALSLLRELTGGSATEDILDKIFSKFCIGK